MSVSIKNCFALTILLCFVVCVLSQSDGKYRPPVRGNKGKYVHKDEGQYVPSNRWRYMHVDDQRHLGKYIHIHNPYGGGYGPYSGLLYPYDHSGDASNRFPTVSNPFQNDVYDYPTPEIYAAYGIPLPSDFYASGSDPENTYTIIKKPTQDIDNIAITELPITKHIVSDLQSTTADEILIPEPINRRTYHDEGGWKIIRQEGDMNKKKYDFLYETENGIYAEEHAKLNKNADSQVEGTNIDGGYYQYTGDDGKLYRVDYSAGENGFVPTGDHIPTPPPVPKEIQRLLEYLKEKNKL